MKDAIMVIRETLQGETLKSSLCTIAVVGVGEPFHVLDQGTVQQIIDTFETAAEQEDLAVEPDVATGQEAAGQGCSTDPVDILGCENQGSIRVRQL